MVEVLILCDFPESHLPVIWMTMVIICQADCRKSLMLKVFYVDCRLPSSHCLLTMCGFPAVPLLTVTARGCATLGSNFSEFVKGMKYNFLLQHSGLSDTVRFIFIVLGDC